MRVVFKQTWKRSEPVEVLAGDVADSGFVSNCISVMAYELGVRVLGNHFGNPNHGLYDLLHLVHENLSMPSIYIVGGCDPFAFSRGMSRTLVAQNKRMGKIRSSVERLARELFPADSLRIRWSPPESVSKMTLDTLTGIAHLTIKKYRTDDIFFPVIYEGPLDDALTY